MSRPPHSASLAAAIAAALVLSTARVEAEGNRVLPFWAQPFPTGYTPAESGFAPDRTRCRVLRQIRTRHGDRTVEDDRCRPVLHARD